MIGESHLKGDTAELRVASDCIARGYKIAIPYGQNWRYDLIIERMGTLEKIQVKFTESDGVVINVRCTTRNGKVDYHYTKDDFDWLAVYDKTTDRVYYIPGELMGDGRRGISLRLVEGKGNTRNTKSMNWAKDFTQF